MRGRSENGDVFPVEHFPELPPALEIAVLGRMLPGIRQGGVQKSVGSGLVLHRRGMQGARWSIRIAGKLGEGVEILFRIGGGTVVV